MVKVMASDLKLRKLRTCRTKRWKNRARHTFYLALCNEYSRLAEGVDCLIEASIRVQRGSAVGEVKEALLRLWVLRL